MQMLYCKISTYTNIIKHMFSQFINNFQFFRNTTNSSCDIEPWFETSYIKEIDNLKYIFCEDAVKHTPAVEELLKKFVITGQQTFTYSYHTLHKNNEHLERKRISDINNNKIIEISFESIFRQNQPTYINIKYELASNDESEINKIKNTSLNNDFIKNFRVKCTTNKNKYLDNNLSKTKINMSVLIKYPFSLYDQEYVPEIYFQQSFSCIKRNESVMVTKISFNISKILDKNIRSGIFNNLTGLDKNFIQMFFECANWNSFFHNHRVDLENSDSFSTIFKTINLDECAIQHRQSTVCLDGNDASPLVSQNINGVDTNGANEQITNNLNDQTCKNSLCTISPVFYICQKIICSMQYSIFRFDDIKNIFTQEQLKLWKNSYLYHPLAQSILQAVEVMIYRNDFDRQKIIKDAIYKSYKIGCKNKKMKTILGAIRPEHVKNIIDNQFQVTPLYTINSKKFNSINSYTQIKLDKNFRPKIYNIHINNQDKYLYINQRLFSNGQDDTGNIVALIRQNK